MTEEMPSDRVSPPAVGSTAKAALKLSPAIIAGWAIGVLGLGTLVAAVLHFGELEIFLAALGRTSLGWLLPGIAFQLATYACAAMIWLLVLSRLGFRPPLRALFRLAVVELFANQAVPTGGVSGGLVVAQGLIRRGVSAAATVTALLSATIAYYSAYLLMASAAFAALWSTGKLDEKWAWLCIVFSLLIIAAPSVLIMTVRTRLSFIPHRIRSLRPVARLADLLAKVDHRVLGDNGLLAKPILLQGSIFLLDAATLWVVLHALGVAASPGAAFLSFVLASVVGTVSPLPLGLGSFEGACVGLLHLLGIRVEEALAATLVFRGLTFWLPMVPGLILMHAEVQLTATGKRRQT